MLWLHEPYVGGCWEIMPNNSRPSTTEDNNLKEAKQILQKNTNFDVENSKRKNHGIEHDPSYSTINSLQYVSNKQRLFLSSSDNRYTQCPLMHTHVSQAWLCHSDHPEHTQPIASSPPNSCCSTLELATTPFINEILLLYIGHHLFHLPTRSENNNLKDT